MFLRAVTTVLALSVPAASVAEGRSDVLMDLLSRTPAEDIDPQISSFRDMWFADIAAAARAMETQSAAMESPRAASIGAFARASAHGLAEFLGTGLEGGWEPLVGFSPLEVEAQLSWGSGYDTALVLRLAPGAADGVAPALLANGYAEETREGLLVYANAVEDDSTADFGEFPREKMGDPFQGPLGYASRVALDGPVLMQSTNWPDLLTLSGRGAPQGHPDLPALATVLDSPDWGEVELIQATLLPHQLDLGGPGSGGIPAWDLGLLADLGSGTEAVGLVLFTYRHAADARDAAKSIAKAWDAPRPGSPRDLVERMLQEPGAELPDSLDDIPAGPSMAELIGLPVETGVAGDGPYVAWVALRGAPGLRDGWIRNPGFHKFYMAMLDRQVGLFGLP